MNRNRKGLDGGHAARGYIAVLACAALLGSAGCESDGGGGLGSGHNFGANNPALVVALGDSVTEGHGYRSYTSFLQPMVGKTVVNAGVGGHTAAAGAARVNGVLGQRPGYLLILLGLNDAIMGVPVEDTVASLGAIIAAARAQQTVPALATLPAQTGPYERISEHVRALNSAIRALGKAQGVPVADVAGQVGRSLISPDGLHPNQEGHLAIAAAFADLF